MLAALVVLVALPLAWAGAIEVNEVRTEMGDAFVAYPQLAGLEDEAVMKAVNDDIVLSADISSHLVTLVTLGQSTWGLQVEYEAYLEGDVFSAVISAKGKMPNGRQGHAYTALTYDLVTGERLGPEALFEDVNAAVAFMEAEAENTMSEELSGYLNNAAVTPLPVEAYTVDADGVTFWYPSDQLSYHSGYSGACQFYWEELNAFLRTDEAGLPARLGVLPKAYTDAEAASLITQCVSEGWLPHVPVRMGDAMTGIAERYRLVRTPDEFPGGRYFVLEAPLFRSVLVISDSIQAGYDASVVEGIQLKRGALYGLVIVETQSARWRDMLGEPEETMAFSQSMAYDYALPVGQSDIYHFGDYELRLHTDESGVLSAIQLCR